MSRAVGTRGNRQAETGEAGRFDMHALVGSILLFGVLLSLTLIAAGLLWHWVLVGHLQFEYSIADMNLFQFVLADVQRLTSGAIQPRLVISTGIVVLMLTPYMRVLASALFFALIEHNWKYTLFTGFVLLLLTYSLFLR